MGIKALFTEHTHFLFNTTQGILLNKMCKWYLKECDATIAVSHACRDNFVLRAKISPHTCFTIPNAVDTNKFTPNPSLRYPKHTINIVMIQRLSDRKGCDMLVDLIPDVLNAVPNAYFIIGGDGDKRPLLDQLVQKFNLQNSVELLGAVPHDKVKDVLNRG